MQIRRVRRAACVLGLCLAGVAVYQLAADANPGSEEEVTRSSEPAPGAAERTAGDAGALYDRFCLACHGPRGDGRGPGAPWLWPRPRDFSRGEYKWRSTPTGRPPTDEDLARVIRFGVPGTSMHAFGQTLSSDQIAALVRHLKSLAPRTFSRAAEPVPIPEPPADPAALAPRGESLFRSLGCAKCHGPEGKGDGPSAPALRDAAGRPDRPYDLTARPLRRPMAEGERGLVAVYRDLVTGLSGTPMPSYQGAAPDQDLWAVAAFVDRIRYKGPRSPGLNGSSEIDPIVFEHDRKTHETVYGRRPEGGGGAQEGIWGRTIALQGKPPEKLAPAQASVDARRCGRCHAKQVREWKGSIHAHAGSPGLIAQLLPLEAHGNGRPVEGCQRCHTPLAEQQPLIRPGHLGGDDDDLTYRANPFYDPELRRQGLSCAGCHLRGWRRYGPHERKSSGLLSLPGYPLTELPIYERADFCIGCHQLPPRSAVAGKPRLNTYREWLEGPYMRRGVQCQHCHMPNREHTWKGVHDPQAFREGIAVTAIAGRSRDSGAVSVRAKVKNAGAGHYLPTTPTPAAWLSVELVDRRGDPIRGAQAQKRIGWHLASEHGKWREIEDTRIPPGESLELAAAWKGGRVSEATAVRVTVRVHPDDFYERLYRGRLQRRHLTRRVRELFVAALERARSSHYVAYQRLVPIQ